MFRPLLAAAEEKPPRRYFAHAAVEDRNGVIAPWYRGLNGQCDFRIRIAAETLKRYPWAEAPPAVMPAPDFVFNGQWGIQPDGTIVLKPKLNDWDNGDVGQRSASLLQGLVGYYRYTGDAAAIGLIDLTADYLLDYCQTPADHPWPGFLISCPTKGKPYGRANPHGLIQLDISAQVGSGLVAAYKLTGNPRYREAIERWADRLAEHCDLRAGHEPWQRYANPQDARWNSRQTAGVSLVLQFLDEVIGLGHQGKEGALREGPRCGRPLSPRRSAARVEPRSHPGASFLGLAQRHGDLLRALLHGPVRHESPPGVPAVEDRRAERAWRVLLPVERRCEFGGGCLLGGVGLSRVEQLLRQVAAISDHGHRGRAGPLWPTGQERLGRRGRAAAMPAVYLRCPRDGRGGRRHRRRGDRRRQLVQPGHPWPLRTVLEMVAWQPEAMGANRENHVVRTSEVVASVRYDKGRVEYRCYDAAAPAEDLLRLAFEPRWGTADGKPLLRRSELSQNGFTIQRLANGDCLVGIRHDGCRQIVVEGDDPQATAAHDRLQYEGTWSVAGRAGFSPPPDAHAASQAGAKAAFQFHGNQVRLIAWAGPDGGKADVYLDGVKQLAGIDFWCPQVRDRQVLYYRNGLAQAAHRLELVATGDKNPRSRGTWINVESVQWSAAEGDSGFGAGGGPTDPQRVIFGYVGRGDYVDSNGFVWRPATEFTLRIGHRADLAPLAFWTAPRLKDVAGTSDPEIYRHGVYGPDFTAYFTVAPAGTYRARLHFCQAEQPPQPGGFATTIDIQGKEVVADMDIAAKAGGLRKAVALEFSGIRPRNGIIAIRFRSRAGRNAMIQAVEIEKVR